MCHPLAHCSSPVWSHLVRKRPKAQHFISFHFCHYRKIASPPSGARRKSSDHHRPSSRPGPLRATHSIDVGIPSAASDSRGLATLQLDGPEHVTLRTSGRSKSERVVQVITGSKPPLKPSPPKSVKPANTRPSSADRFRRMVVDTRGSTWGAWACFLSIVEQGFSQWEKTFHMWCLLL